MGKAIRSEFLKLLTIRATLGVLLGAVVIAVLAYAAPGENIAAEIGRPLYRQQSTLLVAFLMRVLFLVLGIRVITEEWRYGTITPSLLVVPSRARLVAAKVVAVAAAGAAIAVLALGAMLAAAATVAAVQDASFAPGMRDVPVLVGIVASGALWSVIGLGFGAIVKSQLVATVTGLVWLMGAEESFRERLGDLAPYLPGQAGVALVMSPGAAITIRAIETLVVYALIATLGGILLMNRRDFTG